MSLLNPATVYRRSTNRPRVPVVLPLVRVDVDQQGRLAVTVDDVPLPDADTETRLSRDDLRPLLDQLASEQGSALRIEIHEPDGKVFTDFHTPDSSPADGSPAPTVTSPPRPGTAPERRTTLSTQLGSGNLIGTGFADSEEVAIAVVIYRRLAGPDGTIELNLPAALLERRHADLVLVGATSGAIRVTPPEASNKVRKAS